MKAKTPAGISPAKGSRTRRSRPPARLDGEIQARIGEQLRAMHDSVLKEGVPDRFLSLLASLDRRDGE